MDSRGFSIHLWIDRENVMPETPAQNPNEKVVWIACRATPNCPGNQAVMVFSKSRQPTQSDFAMGGSITRYRCKTCGGAFHIGT